jgi:hypothetical protein
MRMASLLGSLPRQPSATESTGVSLYFSQTKAPALQWVSMNVAKRLLDYENQHLFRFEEFHHLVAKVEKLSNAT